MSPRKHALVTGEVMEGYLCERLLSEGYHVIGIDNLRNGSLENGAHLEDEADFEYVDYDVTTYINAPRVLEEIYHLALSADLKDFERITLLKITALGTYNALSLARSAHLMLVSSQFYGDPPSRPQPEECRRNVDPIGVCGVYDKTKCYAEPITRAYHRHHPMDTWIVHIFNTCGLSMRVDDGPVVPSFISQPSSERPLTIHGDASQSRSAQHTDDVKEGIIRLIHSPETGSVKVGDPVEHTACEIAELVLRLPSGTSELVLELLPKDDPKRRCLDISRVREVLSRKLHVPVREGPKKTLGWFAEQRVHEAS